MKPHMGGGELTIRGAMANLCNVDGRITPEAEARAAEELAAFDALGGATLADRTAYLEDDGIAKFAASWTSLLDRVAAKAGALAG